MQQCLYCGSLTFSLVPDTGNDDREAVLVRYLLDRTGHTREVWVGDIRNSHGYRRVTARSERACQHVRYVVELAHRPLDTFTGLVRYIAVLIEHSRYGLCADPASRATSRMVVIRILPGLPGLSPCAECNDLWRRQRLSECRLIHCAAVIA